MEKDVLTKEVEKLIGQKKCQFRYKSEIVLVGEVSDVSVLLEEINSDNEELDNYGFSGQAMIGVEDNGGFLNLRHTINGTAKVIGETVQIKEPVSINRI